MSTVNNWMILSGAPLDITTSESDEELPDCILDLNRRIAEYLEDSGAPGFTRVDHLAGGNKALEADVFLLAESRGVGVGDMLGFITQVCWGFDSNVQILYKGQEDSHWRQLLMMAPMMEPAPPEKDLSKN